MYIQTSEQEKSWVIYGIRSRGSMDYRYIGLTSTTMRQRRRGHIKALNRGDKKPLYDWLRKHLINSVMEVIEEVAHDKRQLEFREQFWIAALRGSGYKLLNLADGGHTNLGFKHSDETKAKMSKTRKGRVGNLRGVRGPDHPSFGTKRSLETREKMSQDRKGMNSGVKNPNYGKFGPEHPSYGREVSAETKAKASEAKKGEKNPNFGKVYTDEERQKLREKQLGVPNPGAKISAHTRHHTNKGVVSDKCSYCTI